MSPFCINFEREIIMILNEVLHLCLSSIVKNGSETKLRSFKVCNLKISPCTCSLVSAKNLKVRLLKSCELFTAVTKGYFLAWKTQSSICTLSIPWERYDLNIPIAMDSKFLFIIPKDNFFEWEAAIVGPEGSPFEDGVFIARLVFPQDDPLNPPSMRFVSTIFHPSISIHMLRLTAVEMYFQLLFTVQSMFLSQLEGKSTIEWSFPLQKVPVFGTTLLTNRFWLILRKCWL